MAETQPYWKKLTHDDVQMLMKLPSVDIMTFDLGRGIGVTVSFHWKPIGRYAKELRNFVKDHPEFEELIETVLTFDTDVVKPMNIHFLQVTESEVKMTLIPSLAKCDCETKESRIEDTISFTFEQACAFIHISNGMAHFLTNDGAVILT